MTLFMRAKCCVQKEASIWSKVQKNIQTIIIISVCCIFIIPFAFSYNNGNKYEKKRMVFMHYQHAISVRIQTIMMMLKIFSSFTSNCFFFFLQNTTLPKLNKDNRRKQRENRKNNVLCLNNIWCDSTLYGQLPSKRKWCWISTHLFTYLIYVMKIRARLLLVMSQFELFFISWIDSNELLDNDY